MITGLFNEYEALNFVNEWRVKYMSIKTKRQQND